MMERLTTRAKDQQGNKTHTVWYNPYAIDGVECIIPSSDKEKRALEKLAAYEDTGLTPETCKDIKSLCDDYVDAGLDASLILACIAAARAGVSSKRMTEISKAESEGRLIVLPCKVGDTVWFLGGNKGIVPERPFVVHEGKVTKIKSVTFSDGTIVFIADIYYEFPDPFYNDGRLRGHEAICSFTKWGSWTRFFLTREEAEAALGGQNHE